MNNKELKSFYEKVYVKGEKKHFTAYRESSDTSEIHNLLNDVNWKSKKILDVGCGTGHFAYNISKKGGLVLGIDYSEKAILEAQSLYTHKNLEFKKSDVSKIKGNFDIIVSNGTLEHMDNPLKSLKLFKKHLNPKGSIIITSPNWTNPRGYILLTLMHLFKSPITLADLHYFTPIDFENFAKKLDCKLSWKTVDRSWGHGQTLIKDLKKRLPNVLKDSGLPASKKQILELIKWLDTNVVSLNNDLPHSGATGIYIFSSK